MEKNNSYQDSRKTAFAKKFSDSSDARSVNVYETYMHTAADENRKNFEAKGRFCMSPTRFICLFIFLIEFLFYSTSHAQVTTYSDTDNKTDPSRFYNIAVIQVLNKTTAKTSVLEMRIGDKINFGSLRIIARKCWQSPLDQRSENKILIDVSEIKSDDGKQTKEVRIFYGWMFASSPSISGLEHPIYDLIALSCKNPPQVSN